MNNTIIIKLLIVFYLFLAPIFAYIGPGMSGGLIAAILGVIGAILLAIFGILYYPIKRFLKNRKKK
tara:strand:- start:1428 stop:1625 length:198 start_codon:yes stop_codon:yes gene_type:complete